MKLQIIAHRAIIGIAVVFCTMFISVTGLAMLLFGNAWVTLLAAPVSAALTVIAIVLLGYLTKRIGEEVENDRTAGDCDG